MSRLSLVLAGLAAVLLCAAGLVLVSQPSNPSEEPANLTDEEFVLTERPGRSMNAPSGNKKGSSRVSPLQG